MEFKCKTKRYIICSVFCRSTKTTTTPTPTNYRRAMLQLIEDIRNYATKRNYPSFTIINNGGVGIFEPNAEHDWTLADTKRFGSIVDAVTVEDINYGTDIDWNMADNQETPKEYRDEFYRLMGISQNVGVRSLVIDYCSDEDKIKKSFELSKTNGFGDCVCTDRELTSISTYEFNHNMNNCYNIKDNNFLVLLNPTPDSNTQFTDKQDYINKLKNTWFDWF